MGFFKKVGKRLKSTAKVQALGWKDGIKAIGKDPTRLLTGIDPVSTGLWNKIKGTDDKALVNLYGSPTKDTFRHAEEKGIDTTGARDFFKIGDSIAGFMGGSAALGGLSNAWNAARAGGAAGGSGAAGGAGGAGTGTAGAGPAGGSSILNGMSNGDLLRMGTGLAGAGLDYLGNRAATRAELEASRAAIDEQRRQYDTTRSDLMPWLEDGRNALAAMNDPNAFRTSPGYDFRRREGLQGVQNSAAAAGSLYSGNALKAITEFGDNLADDEFSNWWNRLASRAGIGQTTATQLGQIGGNTSADIGSLLRDAGSSRASGIRGRYGAFGSAAGTIGGGLDNYFAGNGKINPRSIYDYSTMTGGRGYA
jgi:hypothetical protein